MTPDDLARIHAAANTVDRAWSADEIGSLLAAPGVVLTGDTRAFALGRHVAGELEILTVATHPDHRRRGLARGALITLLQRIRPDLTVLEVAEDNVAARGLYTDLGFTLAGRRRGYYRRRDAAAVDALILTCTQAPRTPPDI